MAKLFLAFSKEEFYKKWGKHFLPSLARAHLLQLCNNFKDPGVQHYGGKLFGKLRDEMDDIFNSLPQPQKTDYSGKFRAQINMATFNNANAGCFHGNSLVSVGKNETKLAKLVCPGDFVLNSELKLVKIKYITKYSSKTGEFNLVELENNLLITAYHPVQFNKTWQFPIDLTKTQKAIKTDFLYNFVIENSSNCIINNIPVIGLGHGIEADPVASHDYYGTKRIVEDLQKLDEIQQNNGIITYNETHIQRDANTGLVAGIYAD